MVSAYFAFGSNLGDRGKNIQDALVSLERWGVKIIRTSSLYESEPFGVKDQGWFFNMVAEGETDLTPEDLLKAIHAIEKALKRERVIKWGPRTIDIDILYYGDLIIDEPGLVIPHVGIPERRFVLLPMDEIASDYSHPLLHKTTAQLLNDCPDTTIVNIHY